MTIKTIQKNQKPIDQDIHLKYICNTCDAKHWLSLTETQTKNYKIVCDCGSVIKPKRITNIKFIYSKKKRQSPQITKIDEKVEQTVPVDLFKKCTTILVGYGYDAVEAQNLVKKCYLEFPNSSCAELIKQILKYIGSQHHGESDSSV
jgi:DNA-directed RNA polymerase subunit RPC12/RpoP